MIVEQVSLIAHGPSNGAIYNAFRDIVATKFQGLPQVGDLPASVAGITTIDTGIYRTEVHTFTLSYTTGDVMGRFCHFLISQVAAGPSIRQKMRDMRTAAKAQGIVTSDTIAVPARVQARFGTDPTVPVWRHSNGAKFALDTRLAFPVHGWLGVDAHLADLA